MKEQDNLTFKPLEKTEEELVDDIAFVIKMKKRTPEQVKELLISEGLGEETAHRLTFETKKAVKKVRTQNAFYTIISGSVPFSLGLVLLLFTRGTLYYSISLIGAGIGTVFLGIFMLLSATTE